MKKILFFVACGVFLLSGCSKHKKMQKEVASTKQSIEAIQQTQTVIILDPGHGGTDFGASITWHGKKIYEKDLNLKIALFLKNELETYKNVKVYLTRSEDQTVGITDRVQMAKKKNAEAIISLHNNAKGTVLGFTDGYSVLVSKGNYKASLARRGQRLGASILNSLQDSGLSNRGLVLRTSENNSTYPNGALSDYYGIVRQATERDIIGMIVEHAFLDWSSDYEAVLSTDDKLEELARLDANGIAAYYNLQKKDGAGSRKEIEVEVPMVFITDGKSQHNKYVQKKFIVRQ